MIELAPGHKIGLPVANPVLIAGGMIGYGEVTPRGLTPGQLGAVVVGPCMRKSHAGAAPPRYAATEGGCVVQAGPQNRGLNAIVNKFSRYWPRLGCPVIVQLVDARPQGMAMLAGRLAQCDGVQGVELASMSAEPRVIAKMVEAVAQETDLPLWLKCPLHSAHAAKEAADAAVSAGVTGLVVGQPVQGALLGPPSRGETRRTAVTGAVYGPLVFAQMLAVLMEIAGLDLPAALIACGGIHSPDQMHQALAAGASAIQVDSALWVEPALPHWLLGAWAAGTVE